MKSKFSPLPLRILFPQPPVQKKHKPDGRCSIALLLYVPTQTSKGEFSKPSLQVSRNANRNRSFYTPKILEKKLAFQSLYYSFLPSIQFHTPTQAGRQKC